MSKENMNTKPEWDLNIEIPENVELYLCTQCHKLHVEYDSTPVKPEGRCL